MLLLNMLIGKKDTENKMNWIVPICVVIGLIGIFGWAIWYVLKSGKENKIINEQLKKWD